MATTHSIHPTAATLAASEDHAVHTTYLTLKILFTAVPIIAGLDKFTNLLANWQDYLNPLALRIIPVTAGTFMMAVGVIEIIAGVIVFLKPRLGAIIVTAWLIAIALQLILWGRFLDVAVRDLVMAIGGAWTLARLTPFGQQREQLTASTAG